MDDDMDFDPSDLETYTNKRASELLSNALSRLGHKKLGYENYNQAFSELGKVFWVKPNTVKNDRDSFDPFYDNDRAGWHQAGSPQTRAQANKGLCRRN